MLPLLLTENSTSVSVAAVTTTDPNAQSYAMHPPCENPWLHRRRVCGPSRSRPRDSRIGPSSVGRAARRRCSAAERDGGTRRDRSDTASGGHRLLHRRRWCRHSSAGMRTSAGEANQADGLSRAEVRRRCREGVRMRHLHVGCSQCDDADCMRSVSPTVGCSELARSRLRSAS